MRNTEFTPEREIHGFLPKFVNSTLSFAQRLARRGEMGHELGGFGIYVINQLAEKMQEPDMPLGGNDPQTLQDWKEVARRAARAEVLHNEGKN